MVKSVFEMVEIKIPTLRKGTVVELIESMDSLNEIGIRGIIRGIHSRGSVITYNVYFKDAKPIFHDCNGTIEDKHGYNISANKLRKVIGVKTL